MKSYCTAVTLAVLAAATNSLPAADSPAKSPVGRTVEDFTLADHRGKEHSLSDFAEHKLLVVAFLGAECPLAKLYGARLAELHGRYEGQGVGFVGVNANTQDSLTEIAAYARRHGIEFPILKDVGNHVADAMGAVRTPEVFVLDGERVVRYWGRIDDQYGIGVAHKESRHAWLADALDELLAGKAVSTPSVPSVGCHIGRIQQPEANAEVTWSNQISRIFQKRCVECHREGEIAPFALTEYEEVVGWADMIAEVVSEKRMPPWHADPKYPAHGRFANDRSLTEAEEDLIDRWVRAGAPEGDANQLPPPVVDEVAGWQLPREPDVVVSMDEPFDVPAEGEVRYIYQQVDPGFTEDKWVQAVEVVPGNRAVVHHVLVLVRPPKDKDVPAYARSEWLGGYVPGLRARPYPKGMAKLIPAGSTLIFQLHYTPNGSPAKDRSKVGLILADPAEIDHAVVTTKAANRGFEIPPGDANYNVEAKSGSLPVDVKLLAFMPHMHLRGKSFSYEAVFPGEKTEMLLDVPRYDFNWQTSYRLAEPITLPAGTRMHCVAHFDNSEDNLANPDPTRAVTWGDQTWEEMMIGYFDIAVPVRPQEVNAKPNEPAAGDRVEQLLRDLDADGSGTIERGEAPKRYKSVFDRLDRDGDDKLTREELRPLGSFLPR
jgi:peroxiredoxin